MLKIRRQEIRQADNGEHSRRGAMLVLAIFSIVLASSLTVLVMAGTAQLVRSTRHHHEEILLRQMTDSAFAWVRAHPRLDLTAPVQLDASRILPDDMPGSITLSIENEAPNLILVASQFAVSGKNVKRSSRFIVAPSRSE